MVTRPPRDEREWRALVERQIRQATTGVRPLVVAAVGDINDTIDDIEAGMGRQPTAPIELTHQTSMYLDTSGRQRARVMIDFPNVTKATDATDITIERYELWGKPDGVGLLELTPSAVPGVAVPYLSLPGLAATPENLDITEEEQPWRLLATNTESFFRAEDFIPRRIPPVVWRFRVRAIGTTTTIPGQWSVDLVIQMLPDTTPPGQPTAPVLTVDRGTITATWDGQSVSGAMPADFKYCVLAHGTDSSPTFEIARFGRGGGFKVVANFPYYDPQFFRLQAVDESGNRSAWSEQAVGFTTPLVDRDIILSTIDAAQTHLKNINAGVSILPNTIITEHLVVTEEMTAAIANFLHVRADMLEVNEIWADEAWFGVADAILVRSDMFEGRAFTGGTFTGSLFQSNVEALTGIKLDSTGLKAWSPGGVQTFSLSALTGEGVFTGKIQSGTGLITAQIDKAVYTSRPGLRLTTTFPCVRHPAVWSMDDLGAGWAGVMTMASARETSTSNTSEVWLGEDGRFFLGRMAASGLSSLYVTAGIDVFGGGGTLPAEEVHIAGNGGELVVGADSHLISASGAYFQATDGDEVLMLADPTHYVQTTASGGTTISGGLNVSGTKNFLMDHPTKPGWDLMHGSTESPVSGIEYWGSAMIPTLGQGPGTSVVITLPAYFEALAKPGNRAVFVTRQGGTNVTWTDIVNGAFTVTGAPGTKFSWLVKAERRGADFQTEQPRVE